MDTLTISMEEAAWLASFIKSFPTKAEFVKNEMNRGTLIHKHGREKVFENAYDQACPVKTKPVKRVTRESIE